MYDKLVEAIASLSIDLMASAVFVVPPLYRTLIP